ncbi:unnamed protein product [Vitrella brassicaformis CCMP3155]|uniref:FAD-binding domain-containing protein n=1 Tax=Vitrella brassicaformis (strain CCMP3155) TaxID=1169540 RepID=A0A0G4E9I7_VITBC|nr:unnamed protein product [Vitrella brassicaformis CCMP3155]|eukprot:CEL92542.1 unnamed protein product [Vitrella brassicaformis CCMP3155]
MSSRRGLISGKTPIDQPGKQTSRSINFALSERGRSALRAVQLEDAVLQDAIPMYSRMVHPVRGSSYEVPYGERGECIYSVGRRRINELLLNAASASANVSLHFGVKLSKLNCERGTVTLTAADGDEERAEQGDFVFGCDGIHSASRHQMLQQCSDSHSFREDYIDHGYKELTIESTSGSDSPHRPYAMPPNHLHIWPRKEFMLIALPNPDGSFTCTLFMPMGIFETLTTPDQASKFFKQHFPDVLDLIGESELDHQFRSNPTSRLSYLHVSPWTTGKYCVVGDAAHAVVPFYGQGMNCGFEDCLLFDQLLQQCQQTAASKDLLTAAAQLFYQHRKPDADALCQLSLENYIEMRSKVSDPLFLMKKRIDSLINYLFPHEWIPQYTMVAFTRTRYSDVIRRRDRQNTIVTSCASGLVACALAAAALLAVRCSQALLKRTSV